MRGVAVAVTDAPGTATACVRGCQAVGSIHNQVGRPTNCSPVGLVRSFGPGRSNCLRATRARSIGEGAATPAGTHTGVPSKTPKHAGDVSPFLLGGPNCVRASSLPSCHRHRGSPTRGMDSARDAAQLRLAALRLRGADARAVGVDVQLGQRGRTGTADALGLVDGAAQLTGQRTGGGAGQRVGQAPEQFVQALHHPTMRFVLEVDMADARRSTVTP